MDNSNKRNLEKMKREEGGFSEAEKSETDPLLALEQEEAKELASGKLDFKKNGSLIIDTLNLVSNPIARRLKSRHERFYRDSKFHLVADIFFVLLILGLVVTFLYFYTLQPKAQIDLSTTIDPGAVASGQNETFTIQYKNNGKVDIKAATISLIFPKNFALNSVSPQNSWSDQTNTFSIGDLPRGANGKVKVSGAPFGAVGSQQTLTYSLNYQENGRAANTLGSYVYPLGSSVLSVSFDAPKQVYQNLDFAGNINLKNNGLSDVPGEIDLAFTNSAISLKSVSADQANLVNGVIIVNGLKAGQSLMIGYEAAVSAAAGTFPAVLAADLNLDGQQLKQTTADSNLNVTVPTFGVAITADKNIIKSEETVKYKLNFINKETSSANNTTITIVPADNSVILKNLTLASSSQYKISGNTVAVGDLAPGQTGEIDFSAVLSRQTISVNQQTGIIADVNYQVNGRQAEYQMFGPKIKFSSVLQVVAKGLYYSAQGDQLGVGPLPPVVDVPTNYWIFWEIDNSGNELKNFTVTADLPSEIGWTNQKTVLSGDLQFGQISRKAIWTVDDVAASGGNYRAGFEVELIPTAADLGKVPTLLANIQYSATDAFTGAPVSGGLPDINANLKDDPTASGKGKVIELLNIVK